MTDARDPYAWEVTPALIPSGAFIAKVPPIPGTYDYLARYGLSGSDPTEIFNPMPHPGRRIEHSDILLPARQVRESLTQAHCVTEEEISSYAERLVEISNIVKRNEAPDCVIAPLRGALKPTLLLKVVAGLPRFEPLPFQNRSSESRRQAMRSRLAEILDDNRPERENYKVLVVDTAIGGYGVQDLCQMISEAARQPDLPPLQVTFHILHSSATPNEAVARMKQAAGEGSSSVRFRIYSHPVPSLIVEDWDAALGVELVFDGERFAVKPTVEAGQLYVRSNEGLRVLETSDLSGLLLEKMAEYTSDAIRTDPSLAQVAEVWKDNL